MHIQSIIYLQYITYIDNYVSYMHIMLYNLTTLDSWAGMAAQRLGKPEKKWINPNKYHPFCTKGWWISLFQGGW